MENHDIDFIASRYRTGLFAVGPALQRILPTAARRRWSAARVAVAASVVIALGAAAALIIGEKYERAGGSVDNAGEQSTLVAPADTTVRVIDFEETPLPVVVEKIKEVYGVEVTGLPDNAADCRLSLRYEGTAADLVATVNEILDTKMEIVR